MIEFRDKVAIVTGGCGAIGSTVVEMLARAGANVVAADLTVKESAERTGHPAPGTVVFQPVDVTNARSVTDMVDAAVRHFGGLDILVTVAGIIRPGSAATLSEAEWDRLIDINLKGTFLCCQAAIAPMRARGGGRIVTIGSVLGKNGGNPRPWIDPAEQERAGNLAYGASKAGVHALTAYLAKELARDAITVNCVAPGPIATGMTAEFPESLRNLIPVGRMGSTRDVARAVLYLASPETGFVTGEIHDVNGGIWPD